MSIGWIKLHREIKNHWIWGKPEYFQAFVAIIMECNHTDQMCLISGELIECKRGQKIYSLSTWAKIFGKGWTVQKVRTFLKLLESDSIINTQGLRKTTRLTLINYETYQSEKHTNDMKITDSQHRANTEITQRQQQLKNVKNVKNEKNNTYPEKFELFWTSYPKRNGKREGKKPSLVMFNKIKADELDLVLKGTKIYSTKCGEFAKDPVRFLRDEIWRDLTDIQKEAPKRDLAAETRERYNWKLPQGVR